MARGVSKKTKKIEESIFNSRVVCKCGCVSLLTPKTDYCICRWCGHKLYRNEQIKFRYEVKGVMKNKSSKVVLN